MDWIIPDFTSLEIWMSLLTLTFLEIVLGIDNIVFISIVAGKLPEEERKKATSWGLVMALVLRVILLLGISAFMAMQQTVFSVHASWIEGVFTGQSLVLFAGGLFLMYKSTSEIHHKLEGEALAGERKAGEKGFSLGRAIVQIALLSLVFSFDSILTAIGMTSGLEGALFLMITAVVISMLVMMLFAVPVGRFVNAHPTVQMLGMAFLLLIGFMLIAEGAHLAGFKIAGAEVGSVPKGYLYFAIAFSLFVEFLNLKLRKQRQPVKLHTLSEKASEEGLL